jgi:hypothetical protein
MNKRTILAFGNRKPTLLLSYFDFLARLARARLYHWASMATETAHGRNPTNVLVSGGEAEIVSFVVSGGSFLGGSHFQRTAAAFTV